MRTARRRTRAIRSITQDPTEEAFEAFHQANPDVLRDLITISRTVKQAGIDRWSIVAAFEVLRYNGIINGNGPRQLNNNFRPLYARLVMSKAPDLEGFFETRARTT